ncbi:MAG: hypothetical protein L0191_06840 [Acidobacteria bacterium]|nr:hypothetical protein [Acidobacteriota bacterium]
MRSTPAVALLWAMGLLLGACSTDGSAPTSPASATLPVLTGGPWGPETPPFNLEVILRGDGFGLVKFRQPNDDAAVIYLDIWVRDLAPNSEYLLQRAVDPIVDDDCTSTSWLTLGKGLEPQSIATDANGTGQEELFRNLAAFPPGAEFDIHFQVVNAVTLAVVLQSECYQFRISL